MTTVRVDLLGGLRLLLDGVPLPVTSSRQAALLACLALHVPRPVEVDAIIAALWGAHPPGRPEQAVQQYISTLRTLLEPDRAPRRPAAVLVTEAAGYRLDAVTDIAAFDRSLALTGHLTAERHSAPALAALDEGLALWRGPALAGMPDTDPFNESRRALEESHTWARERRLGLLLDLGRHAQVVADARVVLTASPMREGVWARLVEALYRSGRTAEAFAALDDVRRRLDTELGVVPGQELRQLHARMVRRDPSLAAPSAVTPPPLAGTLRVEDDALPWLEFRDGQRVLLGPGSHLLGRHPDSAVVLVDSRVSRVHAEVRHTDDGQVTVRDRGSTNATHVNGAALSPDDVRTLLPGDVLGLGGVVLTFHRQV